MKLSFSTSFAKLSVLIFLAAILLTVGGRTVALVGQPEACVGWPICTPQGSAGWGSFFHRASVGLTGILMLVLLYVCWRRHRDHPSLLPLTTAIVTLYFAQIFAGAVFVTEEFTRSIGILHSTTAVVFWLALIGLLIISGSLSSSSEKEFPPLDLRQRAKDFLALSKPIIVLLLLVTTFVGMVLGAQAFPSLALTFWTLLGGAFAASGSGALNQYIDRNLDQLMQRTATRPLAAGRMTPPEGLAFGLSVCIIGVYILAVNVNFLAALLSLAGILYYVVLYSLFLKNVSVHNIVIGGGAGAIPPMVGWAAATGSLSIPAWILFAIIFFWTPPHFWALAIVRANDYERAGVPMLPVVRGEKETRRQILVYTIGLVILTLVMPMLTVAGNFYLVSSILLGLGLIFAAWRVYKIEGNKVAWQMYRISSMYLAFIFIALMVDTVM